MSYYQTVIYIYYIQYLYLWGIFRGSGGGNLRVSRTPSMGFLNETFTSFLFPCPPSIDIITDGSVYYTSPLQEHLIRANDLYERYVGPLLIAYKELLKFIKLVIENFFPQELPPSLF